MEKENSSSSVCPVCADDSLPKSPRVLRCYYKYAKSMQTLSVLPGRTSYLFWMRAMTWEYVFPSTLSPFTFTRRSPVTTPSCLFVCLICSFRISQHSIVVSTNSLNLKPNVTNPRVEKSCLSTVRWGETECVCLWTCCCGSRLWWVERICIVKRRSLSPHLCIGHIAVRHFCGIAWLLQTIFPNQMRMSVFRQLVFSSPVHRPAWWAGPLSLTFLTNMVSIGSSLPFWNPVWHKKVLSDSHEPRCFSWCLIVTCFSWMIDCVCVCDIHQYIRGCSLTLCPVGGAERLQTRMQEVSYIISCTWSNKIKKRKKEERTHPFRYRSPHPAN